MERRSKRSRNSVNYAAMEAMALPLSTEDILRASMGGDQSAAELHLASRWVPVVEKNEFDKPSPVVTLPGKAVSYSHLREQGFLNPIFIPNTEGLQLTLPSKCDVKDVARIIGPHHPVSVIDVLSQEELSGWSLAEWAEFYHTPSWKRHQILNVISLEFSKTALARHVQSPDIIRKIDWLENSWPEDLRDRGIYPQVQYYCLMGVAGSFTDFHIDFGGTSVWYHVHKGKKVFCLIPPTPANLQLYEEWLKSPQQSSTFFGDLADTCYKAEVCEGQTLMIPCGWIHCVYTPVDSLVFGGNFLHSLGIEGQLQCHRIEKRTRIARKFRFPQFESAMWFGLADLLTRMRDEEEEEEDDDHVIDPDRLCLLECEGLTALVKECREWMVSYAPKEDTTEAPLNIDEAQAAHLAVDSVECESIEEMLKECEERVERIAAKRQRERSEKKSRKLKLKAPKPPTPPPDDELLGRSLSTFEQGIDDALQQRRSLKLSIPSTSPSHSMMLEPILSPSVSATTQPSEDSAHPEPLEQRAHSQQPPSPSSQSRKIRLKAPADDSPVVPRVKLVVPKSQGQDGVKLVCAVEGCECVEVISVKSTQPHWRRELTGVLETGESLPEAWSLKQNCRRLCTRHFIEKIKWQQGKHAVKRFSSKVPTSEIPRVRVEALMPPPVAEEERTVKKDDQFEYRGESDGDEDEDGELERPSKKRAKHAPKGSKVKAKPTTSTGRQPSGIKQKLLKMMRKK